MSIPSTDGSPASAAKCAPSPPPRLLGDLSRPCVLCKQDNKKDLLRICIDCGVSVHLDEYYGDDEVSLFPAERWRCVSCELYESKQTPPKERKPRKCILCLRKSNEWPMLQVRRNFTFPHHSFCHYVCAFAHLEAWFEHESDEDHVQKVFLMDDNPEDEDFDEAYLLKPERLSLQCEVCYRTGYYASGPKKGDISSACVQCGKDSCCNAFHVTCALQEEYDEAERDLEHSKLVFFCKLHSKLQRKRKQALPQVVSAPAKKKQKHIIGNEPSTVMGVSVSSAESELALLAGVNQNPGLSFHQDDMPTLINLMVKVQRVQKVQSKIMAYLANSKASVLVAFKMAKLPSSATLSYGEHEEYGGLAICCDWVYRLMSSTVQMEQVMFYTSFAELVECMNVSFLDIYRHNVCAVVNGKSLRGPGHLLMLIEQIKTKTHNSALWYTCDRLEKKWYSQLNQSRCEEVKKAFKNAKKFQKL